MRNGGVSFWWQQVGLPAPTDHLDGDVTCVVSYASVGAITAIKTQRNWNNGTTRLNWDGTTSQITHHGDTLFRGGVDSIELITEDGRGYFLHLERKLQVRLRRRDVPRDLAEALDNRIAQQAAAPNRSAAPSLNSESTVRGSEG